MPRKNDSRVAVTGRGRAAGCRDQPTGPGSGQSCDVGGEVDDHRGDGPYLDHGGEPGDGWVVNGQSHQVLHDGGVASGRDGEELGDALDEAEHDGLPQFHQERTPIAL